MPNPFVVGEKLLAADINKFYIRDTIVDLPLALGSDPLGTIAIGGYTGQNDPDPFFMVVLPNGTNGTIYKFIKDETGAFIYTGALATFMPNNAGFNNTSVVGITSDGTYVYVCFETNVSGASSVTEIKRFALDLTGATTITGVPALGSGSPKGSVFHWDSATGKFWIMTASATVKGYTISGTALTLTDTVTLSVAPTALNLCFYKKPTSAFVFLDGSPASYVQTIRTYSGSGTQTSAVTRSIAGLYNSERGIFAAGLLNFYGTMSLSLIRFNENSNVFRQDIYFKPFNY